MDLTRFEQLADAATSSHWPPHLLAQDEDRLIAVGEALKGALTELTRLESVDEQNATLQEEADEWKRLADQRENDLRRIREAINVHGK